MSDHESLLTLIAPYCPRCGAAAMWVKTLPYQDHLPRPEQVWEVKCSECDWDGQSRRYMVAQ